MIKRLGSLGSIVKLIPGLNQIGDLAPAEKEMKKSRVYHTVYDYGREKKPDILKVVKARIAKGSGTDVADVNRLLKQFEQMKQMMKMFGGGKMPSMPSMGSMMNANKKVNSRLIKNKL